MTLLLCLLCVASNLTHDIVTGESGVTSGKGVASDDDDDASGTDENAAAAAAAARPPSSEFYVHLFELAKAIISLVDYFEDSVYSLPEGSNFVLDRDVPQFVHLKATIRKMTIAGRLLWARASSCAKNKEQKAELVQHWKAFVEALPRVAMPPLLADDAAAQAAAAQGTVFIQLKDAKKWCSARWCHQRRSRWCELLR